MFVTQELGSVASQSMTGARIQTSPAGILFQSSSRESATVHPLGDQRSETSHSLRLCCQITCPQYWRIAVLVHESKCSP
jgi:hypothetical protein